MLSDNSAMKTIAHGSAGARESTANKLAHEGVLFTSTCPKCQQQVLQHGYSRLVLVAFLDMLHPIDAYCPACDQLWSLSAEERHTIGTNLAARDA